MSAAGAEWSATLREAPKQATGKEENFKVSAWKLGRPPPSAIPQTRPRNQMPQGRHHQDRPKNRADQRNVRARRLDAIRRLLRTLPQKQQRRTLKPQSKDWAVHVVRRAQITIPELHIRPCGQPYQFREPLPEEAAATEKK